MTSQSLWIDDCASKNVCRPNSTSRMPRDHSHAVVEVVSTFFSHKLCLKIFSSRLFNRLELIIGLIRDADQSNYRRDFFIVFN